MNTIPPKMNPHHPLESKAQKTPVSSLVTHSGVFHADDVLSFVVLRDLYPSAKLVRTRQHETLAALEGNSVVFDIGGRYDHDRRVYDHHQKGAPVRDDGLPYSAFGLIWRHYGAEWLSTTKVCPSRLVGETHSQIDARLVRETDTLDNGRVSSYAPYANTIGSHIQRMNPARMNLETGLFNAVSPEEENTAFLQAADMTQRFLKDYAHDCGSKAFSRHALASAMHAQKGSAVLVLEQGLPWHSVIHSIPGHEGFMMVAHPYSSSEWCLNGIPTVPEGTTPRIPFPESWRGLCDSALVEQTRVPDARFCHNGGHFAAIQTREGAIAMGQASLRAHRIQEAARRDIKPSVACPGPSKTPQERSHTD